jgi:Cys-tRNA(Pro)/Cys-tRNA(Cys) deacylase
MTPACVELDKAGVSYVLHPYEHDPAAESYGMEAAEVLGVDPEQVFKTLMAQLDTGELVVAVVPVTGRLNLKALARAAGTKKAKMAAVSDAERSSGYVAGGISPFGQRSRKRTFVDETALSCDLVYVSAGRRGLDLSMRPTDLVALVHAEPADLLEP